jgi:cob(I)alamin adenosyltransferase
MVRLDRITTRTGDTGSTGLGDGRRVPKDHPRIHAIGAIDEANSVIGLVRLESLPDGIATFLPRVQNDLFDLGADLAMPPGTAHEAHVPRIADPHLARLDGELERINAHLAPLRSFVLPGGSRAAALLHLARTVVRRAERDLVALMHAEPTVNPQALRYLNRLSDLCFVWARACNRDGADDVAWVPGVMAKP